VWSGERGDAIVGCRAWGALSYQLGQLEDQGHDVEELLRGVPAFVDKAHTPAAFAFRSIEERLEEAADRADTRTTSTATADSGPVDPLDHEPPFDTTGLSQIEERGLRVAGGASAEQVQAAALAYWTERSVELQKETGGSNHSRMIAEVRAINRVKGYTDADMSPFWYLGGEDKRDLDGILARLQAMGAGHRAGERDNRAEQRAAEQLVTSPPEVRQVRADEARQEADLHADQAVSHEVRAAQLAAQGFPVSMREAVAGAVEKSKAGAAAGAGRPGSARPAQRPGQQRVPREPKGR
jgi:hypothetical protein